MTEPHDDPQPRGPEAERAFILWHSYLTGDASHLDAQTKAVRQVFKRLPAASRCRVCNAPFQGVSSVALGLAGFRPGRSRLNPSLCDRCEKTVRRYEVGAEVPLTLLFADVRGSTQLAEQIGVSAFHHLINRFYKATAAVLVQTNALLEKMIGDEVAGIYLPGIAGEDHARIAVQAARALLQATGHADPGGPWIKVGAGVHTGTAYVGAVGSNKSVGDITVLGDVANLTARLASQAGPGEILVSDETCRAAGLDLAGCETRLLQLKGRSQAVAVQVMPVAGCAG